MTLIFIVSLSGLIGMVCTYCAGYSAGRLENQGRNQHFINHLQNELDNERKAFIELRNSKDYAEYVKKYSVGQLQNLSVLQNMQFYPNVLQHRNINPNQHGVSISDISFGL